MKKRALLHLDLSLCAVDKPMKLIVEQLEKSFKINKQEVPSKFYRYE
jgi:hypothetical protein